MRKDEHRCGRAYERLLLDEHLSTRRYPTRQKRIPSRFERAVIEDIKTRGAAVRFLSALRDAKPRGKNGILRFDGGTKLVCVITHQTKTENETASDPFGRAFQKIRPTVKLPNILKKSTRQIKSRYGEKKTIYFYVSLSVSSSDSDTTHTTYSHTYNQILLSECQRFEMNIHASINI